MANKNYDKYLEILMRRQNSESEMNSEINSEINSEGGSKDQNKPYGGFPPLLVCEKSTKIEESEHKVREYSTHKTSVSIKDIMQRRRDVTPFI